MRFISTTTYYFPFFLLTLGPFPFPPLFWQYASICCSSSSSSELLLQWVAVPQIQGEFWSPCGVCSCGKTCTCTHFKSHKTVSSHYLCMLWGFSLTLTVHFLLETTSKGIPSSAPSALAVKKCQPSTLHPRGCPAEMLEKRVTAKARAKSPAWAYCNSPLWCKMVFISISQWTRVE